MYGGCVRSFFVMMVICCLIELSAGAAPARAASLASLKTASCDLYALSQADITSCKANPDCVANEELGTYLRNGGPLSKIAQMCVYRVDDLEDACMANHLVGAEIIAEQARKTMENWIGQTIKYCQKGQMSCAHAIERFGAAWVSQADFAGTLETAKKRIWAIAKGLPLQTSVEPVALSILAELYNRLDAPTACAGD